jgi:uncharacterized protein (TIGR02301 family)
MNKYSFTSQLKSPSPRKAAGRDLGWGALNQWSAHKREKKLNLPNSIVIQFLSFIAQILIALFICNSASFAQQKTKIKPAPAPIIETKPAVEIIPPYEGSILKLAETLGSLSILSSICADEPSATSGDIWRAKAEQLLEIEGASQSRKQVFIGNFNRGFNSYAQVYHHCTPNAILAKQRLLDEGTKLTRELSSRFGN